ncbi:hypothetical protein GN956_G24878 [Arapaima gigas]
MVLSSIQRQGAILDDDPLIFGKGTKLIVLPKGVRTTNGTLSILSNKNKPQVCLAAGYYSEKQEMNITEEDSSGMKTSTLKETNNAPFSTTRKTFFFAGFADEKKTMTDCWFMGAPAQRQEESTPTPMTPSSKECEENPGGPNGTGTGRHRNFEQQKTNFRSLLVHGLRLIFAKVVAFDMMITVKAAFF